MIGIEDFVDLLAVVGNQEAKESLLGSYISAAGPIPDHYKPQICKILNREDVFKPKHKPEDVVQEIYDP